MNKDEKFLGVLFESKFVKIFDSEIVLSDIEAGDDEEFLDFLVDDEEENLLVLSVIGGRKFEIRQYGLNNQSISSQKNKIVLSIFLTFKSATEDQKSKIYL